MTTDLKWLRTYDSPDLPPLSDEGMNTIAQSGLPQGVVNDVFDCVSQLLDVIKPWPYKSTIVFPKTRPEESPPSREFICAHWEEVSGRCQLAAITANATIHELLRAFIIGLNSSNVLTLVLTARAALEHAASFHGLAKQLRGVQERFEAEVFPYLTDRKATEKSSALYQPHLVEALTQFQHGVRFFPDGPPPKTKEALTKWMEQHTYKPKREDTTGNGGTTQPVMSEILDDLKISSRNVVSLLNRLAKKSETMHVALLYALLSEFCHPNADNRALTVVSKDKSTDDTARVKVDRRIEVWGPKRKKALDASLVAVEAANSVHIDAVRDLVESHLLNLKPYS